VQNAPKLQNKGLVLPSFLKRKRNIQGRKITDSILLFAMILEEVV
jgi:hypothetical protein